MSTAHQHLLAANLMAAPELVAGLGITTDIFDNDTAAAIVKVLREQGKTFANPPAMVAALEELPEFVDPDDIRQILDMIPMDPPRVDEVTELMFAVRRGTVGRRATAEYVRIARQLERGDISFEQAVEKTNGAIELLRSGNVFDPTAKASLQRMRDNPPSRRWPLGPEWYSVDAGFHGEDDNGNHIQGMIADSEFGIISAGYKVGKTRTALQFCHRLLDNGARVGYIILEDNEAKTNAKLMASKFDVEHWKILLYLRGKYNLVGEEAAEDIRRMDAAIEWFEGLGDRWQVYDANNPIYNIYDWNDVKELCAVSRMRYGTNIMFFDYFQQLSEDNEILRQIFIESRAIAAKNKMAFIGLSQMSNDTLNGGSKKGMLATKGSGTGGAAVHWGVELTRDELAGDKEIVFAVKVARDAGPRTVYVQYIKETGALLAVNDTPEFIEDEMPMRKGAKK